MYAAAGGSAPGMWQVTWQYLACLIRNGDLYEQLGAWEDALVALKEGLLMVTCASTPTPHSSMAFQPAAMHPFAEGFVTEGVLCCHQESHRDALE